MRVTPLDIQKHRFRRTFLGCDEREVQAFLTSFADQYETVIRENNEQREEIALLREQLKGHEQRGRILKDTLVTAQQTAQGLTAAARREGDVLVKEAELRAEKMLDVARTRMGDQEGRILELKSLRREMVETVRSMLARQSGVLADWEEADASSEKIEYLDAARGQAEGS